MEPVRVLVVADDPLARAGLGALLSGRDDVTLAGESGQADAARASATLAPAVVLWDPGAAGELAAAVAGEVDAPVVALAASEGQAADALRAGARAVLFRGAGAGAIAAAIRAAAEGLAALDASLAREWLRPPEAAPDGEGLTAREREVLALLAEGLANKAIAARLGISEHTAKFHVNAILAKLGAESRAAAIVRAARMGLVVL
jgi:two-component system, NarL family, nitrate/nitrite response regulator NarL